MLVSVNVNFFNPFLEIFTRELYFGILTVIYSIVKVATNSFLQVLVDHQVIFL